MTLPNSVGDEKTILRVEIPRSLYIHQSPGGYFHRIGSSKRQIPPEYLGTLFQQEVSQGLYDLMKVLFIMQHCMIWMRCYGIALLHLSQMIRMSNFSLSLVWQ